MDSIGEFLRQARESQGLSLEQVASITRIQEHFLKALEEDRFEELPQQVFTKGFVRTYARSLDMNEEEALSRFSECSRSFYKKEEQDRQEVLQRIEDDRKGKANRNVVILLTGGLLIGLLFILPREQSSPPASSPPAQEVGEDPASVSSIERVLPLDESELSTQETNSSTQESKVEESGFSRSQDPDAGVSRVSTEDENRLINDRDSIASPTSGARESDSANQEEMVANSPSTELEAETATELAVRLGEGPLLLELQASEITWIVVRADEREPHEALLQPGETAQWRAYDRFLLTLGNAGGVSVKLNGQPRGPFGETGTVIRDLEIKP